MSVQEGYDPTQDIAGQDHVILDALETLLDIINEPFDPDTPWVHYTDHDSPGALADEDTYRALLVAAIDRMHAELSVA